MAQEFSQKEFLRLIKENQELKTRLNLYEGTRKVRHYKGGEYLVDTVPVKFQLSTGNQHYVNDRIGRIIYDGDKIIVYRLLDGSMAFGRFPDEFNDPERFQEIP